MEIYIYTYCLRVYPVLYWLSINTIPKVVQHAQNEVTETT
jgi:hypothetical protein